MQDDSGRELVELGPRKYLSWLERESGVVLEVDARPELPGQVVAAVHLEYVGGVIVENVVAAIDIAIRIVEVVVEGIVGKAGTAEYALLALEGKAGQQLPAMREPLHGIKLDSMVGVVVQFRDVR